MGMKPLAWMVVGAVTVAIGASFDDGAERGLIVGVGSAIAGLGFTAAILRWGKKPPA